MLLVIAISIYIASAPGARFDETKFQGEFLLISVENFDFV